MKFEELNTERLILRKIVQETYDYIYAHYSDEELMQFLGIDREALEKEKQKYAKGMSTYNRSFLNFLMIDKESGNVIGACGYHTWYVDHARAEIGYGMYGEDFKQRGLMTEALKAIIKYGFEVMKLHRIEAMVGPKNVPSLKLVDNMHFTQEGIMRQNYCKNGAMEDSVVFSLLRDEWSGME